MLAVAAGVTSSTDCDRLLDEALGAFGRLDVMVNNVYSPGPSENRDVLDVSDATWEEVLDVKLRGPVRLVRGAARAMLESGRGGSIINVISGIWLLPNSAPGHLPAPRMAPYGTSKAALWMLTGTSRPSWLRSSGSTRCAPGW